MGKGSKTERTGLSIKRNGNGNFFDALCTLLTTMFSIIILVCSFKSMCLPIFVLIGGCVSELHTLIYCSV